LQRRQGDTERAHARARETACARERDRKPEAPMDQSLTNSTVTPLSCLEVTTYLRDSKKVGEGGGRRRRRRKLKQKRKEQEEAEESGGRGSG
jgi:hypothetical protein